MLRGEGSPLRSNTFIIARLSERTSATALETRFSADRRDVAHQRRSQTLLLVVVDDQKRHFRAPGLEHDIAAPADNDGFAASFATATRATWLTKSMSRKKWVSCSENARFIAKKR